MKFIVKTINCVDTAMLGRACKQSLLSRNCSIVCTSELLTPELQDSFLNSIHYRNQVAQHDEGTGCKYEDEHIGRRGQHGEAEQ